MSLNKPFRDAFGKHLIVSFLLVIGLAAQFRCVAQTPIAAAPDFKEIAPGVEYSQVIRGASSKEAATGPWLINLLRVDLLRNKLRLVHAMDEAVGLETVSSMAARYGAVAAINSGYFRTTGTYRGDSIGVAMLEGKLLSETYSDRAALGLIEQDNKTEVIFGHLRFAGTLTAKGVSHTVNGVNRPLTANELIVFTPQFHVTTLTDPDGIEVAVRSGKVTGVRDLSGSTRIPANGYVISAVGSARDWARKNLRKGSPVTLSLQLAAVEPTQGKLWHRSTNIVGGGPQLIKGGKVEITNKEEKILPAFVSDRHPRTAAAKLNSGKLLLVTVDGRQAGVSVGMSLTELANLLLEFGAVDAINLDGGGSTTMIVKNKIVNKPSDQTGERPVSDAILILPRSSGPR